MNVLLLWRDGKKNEVLANKLVPLNEGKQFLICTSVNMQTCYLFRCSAPYFGTMLGLRQWTVDIKTKGLQRPTDTICLNAIKAKIVEEGRIVVLTMWHFKCQLP